MTPAVRHVMRELCCPFGRFFSNPHHLSGTVFAMLITNLASLLWAALVLAQDDALLHAGSRYAFVTAYVHENWLAAGFGTLAAAQLVCLWGHYQPTRFRNAGYAVLSAAWSFVFFHNVTAPHVFPTATALSFVTAFSAFYAWMDGNADRPGRGHDDAR